MFESDAIDHELGAALDYAKLEGINHALLQQEKPAHSSNGTTELENGQRSVQEVTAMITTRKGCDDDNYTSIYEDERHYEPSKGLFVQNNPAILHEPVSPHPTALERADATLPFSQQEKRININSRKLGTLSDEIDYFTSYYIVDERYETVSMKKGTRRCVSEDDTHRPRALVPLRAGVTPEVRTTAETKIQKNTGKVNTDSATKSSRPPAAAVRVAIPKSQSWLQHPNSSKTSGTPATTVQIAAPNTQSSHVQLNPARAALSSDMAATSIQIAAPDISKPHVYPSTARTSKSSALTMAEEHRTSSKVHNSHATTKATGNSGSSATAVQSATPDTQSLHKYPDTAEATDSSRPAATVVQIGNLKTPNSNATSNANPDKSKATSSKNMTDQVQIRTRRRHKKSSRPSIRTTGNFTEVTTYQETTNVPDIDMAKRLQKRRSAVPTASDEVKAPVPTPNKAMDGMSELAAARFHNVKEDEIPKTKDTSPPKTLSKAARKKQNKKQREVDQKERERKEAAELDSAIASNREQVEQMAAAVTLLSISTTEKQSRRLDTDGTNAEDNGGEPDFSSTLESKDPRCFHSTQSSSPVIASHVTSDKIKKMEAS
jgi:hypothetical protein